MKQYEINLLRVRMLQEEARIFFNTEERRGYSRIYKTSLPREYPNSESVENFLWWHRSQGEGDTPLSVDLSANEKFSKHYFNRIIFDHFSNLEVLTDKNFIGDTVVYVEDDSQANKESRSYDRFCLKIDRNHIISGISLLISYEGTSSIFTNSLEELRLDTSVLSRVQYKGTVSRYRELSEEERADAENIFPLMNPKIRRLLRIPFKRNYSENKYKKYYEKIHRFFFQFLAEQSIGNSLQITSSGFHKIFSDDLKYISEESNLLLFGNQGRNFVPYVGLKENGPISGPNSDNPVKFLFIFHEEDRDYANKLFSYLKRGFRGFPGLESFAKLPFEIDDNKTIRFSKNDPIPEIRTAIENFEFDHSHQYAAIYISRVAKDSEDEDKYYYRLKELLLEYEIASQVIYRNNIDSPSFNYFLPNIAIALLAKLGGIPWRLYRPIKNDLVVGVGISRSAQNNYLGSAFCFQNNGLFNGFQVFEEGNTRALADTIREAVIQYVSEYREFDRLVIHYYKKMSRKEEEPIANMLNKLHPGVPYFVLTINETYSRDYVFFDSGFDGKMPRSGTILKTRWNEFLLCNNTRYSSNTATRIDGFPFPIKIKVRSSDSQDSGDFSLMVELIDQVYQFSRMYWKSVRQRSMPVTIEYSKLVAKFVSEFQDKSLVPFAQNTLWFL